MPCTHTTAVNRDSQTPHDSIVVHPILVWFTSGIGRHGSHNDGTLGRALGNTPLDDPSPQQQKRRRDDDEIESIPTQNWYSYVRANEPKNEEQQGKVPQTTFRSMQSDFQTHPPFPKNCMRLLKKQEADHLSGLLPGWGRPSIARTIAPSSVL